MHRHGLRLSVSGVALAWVCGVLGGCGGDSGDKALSNDNPGNNDVNIVAAFGDSLTAGSECPCVPYPARLSGLIGKTVFNAGIGGSKATSNVGRTQEVINQYHPAFLLILYGMNDVIHSVHTVNILPSIHDMVAICKQNNVVPVLATYPVPLAGHEFFANGTINLNIGIRAIADEEGIRCVDLENEFAIGQNPEEPEWPLSDAALLMPDGLHPNDAGTQVMALAFADLF